VKYKQPANPAESQTSRFGFLFCCPPALLPGQNAGFRYGEFCSQLNGEARMLRIFRFVFHNGADTKNSVFQALARVLCEHAEKPTLARRRIAKAKLLKRSPFLESIQGPLGAEALACDVSANSDERICLTIVEFAPNAIFETDQAFSAFYSHPDFFTGWMSEKENKEHHGLTPSRLAYAGFCHRTAPEGPAMMIWALKSGLDGMETQSLDIPGLVVHETPTDDVLCVKRGEACSAEIFASFFANFRAMMNQRLNAEKSASVKSLAPRLTPTMTLEFDASPKFGTFNREICAWSTGLTADDEAGEDLADLAQEEISSPTRLWLDARLLEMEELADGSGRRRLFLRFSGFIPEAVFSEIFHRARIFASTRSKQLIATAGGVPISNLEDFPPPNRIVIRLANQK